MATKDKTPVEPGPAVKTTQPFLKIAALQEGGRHRAGRHWPAEATTVPASDFDKDQIELLRGDKKLVVVEFDQPVEPKPEAGDATQS